MPKLMEGYPTNQEISLPTSKNVIISNSSNITLECKDVNISVKKNLTPAMVIDKNNMIPAKLPAHREENDEDLQEETRSDDDDDSKNKNNHSNFLKTKSTTTKEKGDEPTKSQQMLPSIDTSYKNSNNNDNNNKINNSNNLKCNKKNKNSNSKIPKSGNLSPVAQQIPKRTAQEQRFSDLRKEADKNRKRRLIGPYEVLSVLGRGSQGIVLKAQDPNNPNSIVAIKTLRGGSLVLGLNNTGSSQLNRRSNVGRIRGGGFGGGMSAPMKQASKEIALLKKVNHPNIVRLLDVVDTNVDRDIHLVLEFCTGGPLRQLSDTLLLKNSGIPLPEDEARVYFRQLAGGLRYLHFHGILHRDIKPSNIIVDRGKQILKLTDLGIATQTKSNKASKLLGNDDEIYATSMIEGTPAFLPPEYYRIKRNEEYQFEAALARAENGVNDLEESSAAPISNNNTADVDFVCGQQTFSGRAADVWATGVTLYAFMYGGLPHTFNSRTRRPTLTTIGSSSQNTPGKTGHSSNSREDEEIYNSTSNDKESFLPQKDSALNFNSFIRGSPSNNSSLRSFGGGYRSKKNNPPTQEEIEERILTFPLRFPGLNLGTSGKLRQLLSRMLEKDPRFRITIDEICNHEWLSQYEPMPALSDEQKISITPTQIDQQKAITVHKNIFTKLKQKLRLLRSKVHIFSFSVGIKKTVEKDYENQENEKLREDELNEDEIFEDN